jgi:hypothetical protein
MKGWILWQNNRATVYIPTRRHTSFTHLNLHQLTFHPSYPHFVLSSATAMTNRHLSAEEMEQLIAGLNAKMDEEETKESRLMRAKKSSWDFSAESTRLG